MEIIAHCFLINLNFIEKNMYANLLTRCDDACVITPYLFILFTSTALDTAPSATSYCSNKICICYNMKV